MAEIKEVKTIVLTAFDADSTSISFKDKDGKTIKSNNPNTKSVYQEFFFPEDKTIFTTSFIINLINFFGGKVETEEAKGETELIIEWSS